MAEEVLVNSTSDVITELISTVGSIGLWLQAIGIVIILWVIINIVNWYLNRKKGKLLESIKSDIQRIEKKLDKIPKSIKK